MKLIMDLAGCILRQVELPGELLHLPVLVCLQLGGSRHVIVFAEGGGGEKGFQIQNLCTT